MLLPVRLQLIALLCLLAFAAAPARAKDLEIYVIDVEGGKSVLLVSPSGQFKGITPQLAGVLQAPVIIQANGPRKGADAQSWPVLKAAPGLKDIWQLHFSLNAGKDANPPDDFITNIAPPDAFQWIKISAERGGRFTLINSRNGFSKTY